RLRCVMLADLASLLYFWFPHERKNTRKRPPYRRAFRSKDGRARGAADALRALHDFRLQRVRPAGRSRRPGARQIKWEERPAGARALALLDRRRAYFPAVRLPRAARTLP